MSMHSEISNIWHHYYNVTGTGQLIEKLEDNSGLDLYIPIFDRYFLVYDNNVDLIGTLDRNVSSIIVETYTMAKGLKDSLLFNNQLLNEIRRYNDLFNKTDLSYYNTQHQTYILIWKEYGSKIKEIHFGLEKSKNNMLQVISKIVD